VDTDSSRSQFPGGPCDDGQKPPLHDLSSPPSRRKMAKAISMPPH
jgi:hypothetical protein